MSKKRNQAKKLIQRFVSKIGHLRNLRKSGQPLILGSINPDFAEELIAAFTSARLTIKSLAPRLEALAGLDNVDQKGQLRITKALIALKPKLGSDWNPELTIDLISLPRKKPSRQQQTTKKIDNADHKVQRFYESYDWRRLRYAIIQKYGRECMCCGAKNVQIHVDHIKPLRKNWDLRLDPDNLQVLCFECNHGKGNWDETDFRGMRRRSYEETRTEMNRARLAKPGNVISIERVRR